MNNSDRVVGCLLGGATGDCLGGSYEGSVGPVEIDWRLPWRLSDDTQLTLATCEAIIARCRVDPETIADHFRTWFVEGRVTGIGGSTHKALSELAAGGHWALVGSKGEMAAGNGTAMRIAPLAFCLSVSNQRDRQTIRDVCRITHHHEEAYAGALAVVVAVTMAADGDWHVGGDTLHAVASELPDTLVRDRLMTIGDAAGKLTVADVAAQFGCSGYVVETVPLALFSAQCVCTGGFQDVLEQIIKVGGDTDTIASIAGQVMGAYCGLNGVPNNLITRLSERQMILGIAETFAESVTQRR